MTQESERGVADARASKGRMDQDHVGVVCAEYLEPCVSNRPAALPDDDQTARSAPE